MGRRTIGEAVQVRFPAETLARIDAMTGNRKRAEFIRRAVDLALTAAEADLADDHSSGRPADSSQL